MIIPSRWNDTFLRTSPTRRGPLMLLLGLQLDRWQKSFSNTGSQNMLVSCKDRRQQTKREIRYWI